MPLCAQVDHRSECVLVPIYGMLVPFHILTIKNATNNQVRSPGGRGGDDAGRLSTSAHRRPGKGVALFPSAWLGGRNVGSLALHCLVGKVARFVGRISAYQ
jgi:hypothetical protein